MTAPSRAALAVCRAWDKHFGEPGWGDSTYVQTELHWATLAVDALLREQYPSGAGHKIVGPVMGCSTESTDEEVARAVVDASPPHMTAPSRALAERLERIAADMEHCDGADHERTADVADVCAAAALLREPLTRETLARALRAEFNCAAIVGGQCRADQPPCEICRLRAAAILARLNEGRDSK